MIESEILQVVMLHELLQVLTGTLSFPQAITLLKSWFDGHGFTPTVLQVHFTHTVLYINLYF